MQSRIVVDTNILLYAIDPASSFFEKAHGVIQKGLAGKSNLCIVDKSLYEFYRILTSKPFRSKITQSQALKLLDFYLFNDCFEKIVGTAQTLSLVSQLLKSKQVQGKHIFDIVVIASMLEHDIQTIYTKNVKDFENIEGIHPIDPSR